MDADVVDIGVVGLVLVDGLDDEAGASLRQVPAPVIFDQVISLRKISAKSGCLDGGIDKGVAEKLPAKLHFLASGAKSRNWVTSRAGQHEIDLAVPT